MKNIDFQIEELLTRGVENVYPKKEFLEARLKEGKQLSLYLGIDPTGPTLHLGHIIQIRKLKQFQDLGHKVIFLIGSFTAMIGDPTDKKAARKQLTREQVLENAKLYVEQASKYISFEGENPAVVMQNNDWHDKLNFGDVLELCSKFTVGQMLERDMFQDRVKHEKPIYLHEFMYPLMQGYDCVAMDVDGEVGGNDQTFNMLAGRTLMKSMKDKEKFVVACKLLEDTTGKKMGKSEGNMLSLLDSPEDMYGKVMSWTDDMIINAFEVCTGVEMKEIKSMESQMAKDANPRDFKMKLAWEVVKDYYGSNDADKAQKHFETVFQKQGKPETLKEVHVGESRINILDLLTKTELAKSKSEARRVVEQKGVKVNDEVIEGIEVEIEITEEGIVLQKGKLHYLKVLV